MSEQGLIEILEKVSQQTEKKTTVKVSVGRGRSGGGGVSSRLSCLRAFRHLDSVMWLGREQLCGKSVIVNTSSLSTYLSSKTHTKARLSSILLQKSEAL